MLLGVSVATPSLSDELKCGVAPTIPASSDSAKLGRRLLEQADLLSKLAGTDELPPQVEAARKTIGKEADQALASAEDAFLRYQFCTAVMKDPSLSDSARAEALRAFAQSPAQSKTARSPKAQECDAAAGSPDDPSRPGGVPGVPFDKIDAGRAEAACRSAVQEEALPRLQYELGRALEAGQQSVAEAARRYGLAADAGYAPAQNNLGMMYQDGTGVSQSDTEAVRLYRLAADQGFAPAQFRLALMYEEGRGVAHSDQEIVRLLRLAADQGFAPAQGALGLMFEQGRGVAQSNSEAIRLYRLAAAQGNMPSQRHLDSLLARVAAQSR
jgi:TPR repeat protein